MDLRLTEYFVAFELEERWHAAERVHVQTGLPVSARLMSAVTAGLGHLLVRAGTRLESAADRTTVKQKLALTNPDPCGGCAN
jgi:hypothetical protein